jgi:hypothetical protein
LIKLTEQDRKLKLIRAIKSAKQTHNLQNQPTTKEVVNISQLINQSTEYPAEQQSKKSAIQQPTKIKNKIKYSNI